MNSWKKGNRPFWVFGSLFTLFVFGCSSANLYAEVSATEEINQKSNAMQLKNSNGWNLDRLVNAKGEPVALLPDTKITLFFQDERVSGKSGCNRYFADYRITENAENAENGLSFSKAASTMMACPEPMMEQERVYLEQLTRITSYAIENGVLQLLDDSGEAILVFSVSEPISLIDSTWKLSSFNTGNALLSNLVTGQITAVFDNKGRLSGFAGCNHYSCSYKINEDKLELSPIITTRKFCNTPENAMQTETGFIAALGNAVRYSIKSDVLTLFNADEKSVAVFKNSKKDKRS